MSNQATAVWNGTLKEGLVSLTYQKQTFKPRMIFNHALKQEHHEPRRITRRRYF